MRLSGCRHSQRWMEKDTKRKSDVLIEMFTFLFFYLYNISCSLIPVLMFLNISFFNRVLRLQRKCCQSMKKKQGKWKRGNCKFLVERAESLLACNIINLKNKTKSNLQLNITGRRRCGTYSICVLTMLAHRIAYRLFGFVCFFSFVYITATSALKWTSSRVCKVL